MYLHIFVDNALFYNLPDACDNVLLCLDVVGLGCHFEKSAHVHDEVSVNYCETFNIVLPSAEQSYTVKLSTFANTANGVVYQGEVMFVPTHEDHGITKKLFLATQSDKHNAKICVTPFFYLNPMNMSDVMKCNDVRQAKLQKEFAFLRSRRQHWKDKRASWEIDMEQLLADEDVETKLRTSSKGKAVTPSSDTAKPKLRKTVMGVGYAKVTWPEETPEITRQKLLHRLALAEERRLALRTQAKTRLHAANDRHTTRTKALQSAKQREQASNAKLRCVIEKKENEIKYLRKLLHDAGAVKTTQQQKNSNNTGVTVPSRRKATPQPRYAASIHNLYTKKSCNSKENTKKKKVARKKSRALPARLQHVDTDSISSCSISFPRPHMESVDSVSLLRLLADTMENENNNEEMNLLSSLLQPNSPHENDTAADVMLSEWKRVFNSDDETSDNREEDGDDMEGKKFLKRKGASNSDLDDESHSTHGNDNDIDVIEKELLSGWKEASNNDIDDGDLNDREDNDDVDDMEERYVNEEQRTLAPQDIMSDIDSITQAVSSLEVKLADLDSTEVGSTKDAKAPQGNIEMQLNSLQQRLEDALKLFATPQK